MKKYIIVAILALMPVLASAAVIKYTFSDVDINGQITEIEAVVKDTRKNDFVRCDYYSDNYAEWLGYYSDAISGDGSDADVVESFCVDNFDNLVQ